MNKTINRIKALAIAGMTILFGQQASYGLVLYDFNSGVGTTDYTSTKSYVSNESVQLDTDIHYFIAKPDEGQTFQNGDTVTIKGYVGSNGKKFGCKIQSEGGQQTIASSTGATSKSDLCEVTGTLSLSKPVEKLEMHRNGTQTTVVYFNVSRGGAEPSASTETVTVEVPEVAGATAQLLAFNADGGWARVATDEVPSNATVRVVWTAENGKGLTGEGVANVFTWQTEFVASNSVQTAPQPTVVEAGETEVTLNLDTRTKKAYFDTADILPIWAAQGAEVEVEKEGGEKTSLVKNMSSTNTFAWVPASIGVYDFSHTDGLAAQIIYTTPVEVTTNGLEVASTTVAVTVDGSPLPEDGIVATNSTIVATWTAAPGVFFADGSATYTQTFTADKAVNAVSEAVTKPEEPAAPKVLLGAVAQRYPWDGKIDVQYWAKNTPNTGYEIEVTVTLPDGTQGAKTLQASERHPALNGKNVTTFDAKAAFGEVEIPKGVKVRATLNKMQPL